MKRIAIGTVVAGLVLSVAAAQAQVPGGQTGGTSGGTGSASSNGGQGDAGGTGQTGVRTQGSGKPATGIPDAGSSVHGVGRSPMIGTGVNGDGGVMTGTTGTAPAAAAKPGSGNLDGIASGKAPQ